MRESSGSYQNSRASTGGQNVETQRRKSKTKGEIETISRPPNKGLKERGFNTIASKKWKEAEKRDVKRLSAPKSEREHRAYWRSGKISLDDLTTKEQEKKRAAKKTRVKNFA